MNSIAIIGAGGFVGSHLVESLVLDGFTNFYAIARGYGSLARLSRLGPAVNIRIADATEVDQLTAAFEGCSRVVNLVATNADGIVRSTKAIYAACQNAGVQRLIHMSSAVIYGHVDSPEIRDDASPIRGLRLPYDMAKAESEAFLHHQTDADDLEVVVLRPGIIWGPRSPWSCLAARNLLDNTAYLIGDDGGICNAVYIDNLVSGILTCCGHKGNASGFFNIADQETITWRDFYASLAAHCDYDMSTIYMSTIYRVPNDRFRPNMKTRIEEFQVLVNSWPIYQWGKAKIPEEIKSAIKEWISNKVKKRAGLSTYRRKKAWRPTVTREMWNLQNVQYKLSHTQFATRFDYTPRSRLKRARDEL